MQSLNQLISIKKNAVFKPARVDPAYKLVGALSLGALAGAALVNLLLSLNLPNNTDLAWLSAVAGKNAAGYVYLAEHEPVRLRIPSLGIDHGFFGEVDLNFRGEVNMPRIFNKVGWYEDGPYPGEKGPAVVLGQVDSIGGPAIFYRLGWIEVGDEVFVDRADGTTAVFTVTELERLTDKKFPKGRVLRGEHGQAELLLVTAFGVFNNNRLRYSHNLIVHTVLTRMEEDGKSLIVEDKAIW